VVRVDVDRNLILIKGAVPGSPSGTVIVKPTSKSA
jgi:large subunit ribosomal protein L3